MICWFGAFVLGEVFALVNLPAGVICCCFMAVITVIWIMRSGQSRLWLVLPVFYYLGLVVMAQAKSPVPFDSYMEAKGMERAGAVLYGRLEKIEIKGDSLRLWLEQAEVQIGTERYGCRPVLVYADGKTQGIKVIKTAEKGMRFLIQSSAETAFLGNRNEAGEAYLRLGNRLKITGVISAFEEPSNPGQFDRRSYYQSMNINYCFQASACELVDGRYRVIHDSLWRIRLYLESMLEHIAEERDAQILSAMILGDKTKLDDEIKEVYQENGIAHILAISGLHISMIGSGLYRLLRKGFGCSFGSSSAAGGMVIIAYCTMTGGSISAFRAAVMFVIFLTAECLGRTYDLASSLSLAAIMILCEYPMMIVQSGFQLSVVCVLVIALAAPVFNEWMYLEKRWQQNMGTSLMIQLFTLPILLYHQYYYPVYALFLNLLVLPLMGILTISGIAGILSGCICKKGGIFCMGAAHYILDFYEMLCYMAGRLPLAKWLYGSLTLKRMLGCLLVLSGGVWAAAGWMKKEEENAIAEKSRKKKGRNRWFLLISVFVLLLCILRRPKSSEVMVTVMDVGQGDGICVTLPGKISFFIDGGSSSENKTGEYRILPLLNAYGIKRLDYLFLTHADEDHINGAREVVKAGRTACIVLPDQILAREEFDGIVKAAVEENIEVMWIHAGESFIKEAAKLTCIHPEAGYQADTSNGYSLVLLLCYGKTSVMFTGDLDEKGEMAVLAYGKQAGISLDVDLLKVAHHGSKHSTSAEFLKEVRPEMAIISCSENNRYGHPHPEVLERLSEIGSDIYLTKDSGALICISDGKKWAIEEYRRQRG